jgi:hypothetical protein
MFGNVQIMLDENSTIWSTIPVINEQKNHFDELIQRIEVVYDNNPDNSKAITREKQSIKEAIYIKASIMAATLYAFAEINDNEALKLYKGMSKSAYERLRETELVTNTQNLVNDVRINLEPLAPFGISESQVTELETSLDDFKGLIGEARNVRNSVFANIKEADQLFDEANDLLRNRLDKLMKIFEVTHPKTFDLYTRARVIVN